MYIKINILNLTAQTNGPDTILQHTQFGVDTGQCYTVKVHNEYALHF